METEKYFNQSTLRALDILEAVGKERGPIGLSELSRRVGLHKSTVHRLVLSLESRGWLMRELESGKYRLGIKFITVLGQGGTSSSFQEIRPLLQQLSEQVNETVILSVWDGREVVCVDKVETAQRIQVSSHIGRNFPIYAGGTGFGVLIGMPETMVSEILDQTDLIAYTPLTLTDRRELIARYREMREKGYVLSSGQVDQGVTGIAMPLYFPYEQCYGSVGVVLPDMRADGEVVERIIGELRRSSNLIRHKLDLR